LIVLPSFINLLMSLYKISDTAATNRLGNLLERHRASFHPVVDFNPAKEKLVSMDFSSTNTELSGEIIDDTEKFSTYISNKLLESNSRYGIGGYAELRTVYSRSKLFNEGSEEPRRLHLGMDIWGKAGEKVYAPMGGMIHSLAFNNHFGDYGATIIVLHQLEGIPFYTLYGHLALRDIEALSAGNYISRGQAFAHFGETHENGHWPPHLHFQIIDQMGTKEGDYPGVCKYSEREKWLKNSPDPDFILNIDQFTSPA